MNYVSRPKIFIHQFEKALKAVRQASDFFSFKSKNQSDETFIDNLLLSVLLMVTCFDSPALSLWQCRFVLVKQDILSEY